MLGAVTVGGKDLDKLIVQISSKHGVDPALTKAIMATESSFDVNARRAEPKIKDASIGLMQVLMKTARWMLNRPQLSESELVNPVVNIEAGVKYIKYQMGRYSDIKDVIAAYNAGSVKRTKTGDYINPGYVAKVYPRYLAYKAAGIVTAPSAIIGWVAAGMIGFGLLIYQAQRR